MLITLLLLRILFSLFSTGASSDHKNPVCEFALNRHHQSSITGCSVFAGTVACHLFSGAVIIVFCFLPLLLCCVSCIAQSGRQRGWSTWGSLPGRSKTALARSPGSRRTSVTGSHQVCPPLTGTMSSTRYIFCLLYIFTTCLPSLSFIFIYNCMSECWNKTLID